MHLADLQNDINEKTKTFFNNLLKWNLNSQYTKGKLKGFIPKATFPMFRYEPYPEITGYGTSLFTKLYKIYRKDEYFKRASWASHAILKQQLPSGAFKYSIRKNSEEMLFDTLMMLNGLLDFYEISKDENILRKSRISLERLLKLLEIPQYKNPDFCANSINAPYFHLAKGIILLVKAFLTLCDSKFLRTAEKLAHFTINKFQYQDGGFRLDINIPKYNRFHYLCYALEGLTAIESQNPEFFDNIRKGATYILYNQKTDGGIWYSFTNKGKPIKNLVDNAATAQAARIFLFVYNRTHENEFLVGAIKALNYLINKQHKTPGLTYGGLPFGYHPIIDNLAACSWATQFATDLAALFSNTNTSNDKENLPISF
jgi:hypothetical protein